MIGGVISVLLGSVCFALELVKVETSMIKVLVDRFDDVSEVGSGIAFVSDNVNCGVVSGVDEGRGIVFELVRVNLDMEDVNVSDSMLLVTELGSGVVEIDIVAESGLGI